MFKRFFQIAAAFVAVGLFVLAPFGCQQAEQPAETTETAKPAGPPSGKKLMVAQPKKAEEAVEVVEEVVEGEPVAEEAEEEAPVEGK